MYSAETDISPAFPEVSLNWLKKKCIICLQLNTTYMWIFRIVYFEKKDKYGDSSEIFTDCSHVWTFIGAGTRMTLKYVYYTNG